MENSSRLFSIQYADLHYLRAIKTGTWEPPNSGSRVLGTWEPPKLWIQSFKSPNQEFWQVCLDLIYISIFFTMFLLN